MTTKFIEHVLRSFPKFWRVSDIKVVGFHFAGPCISFNYYSGTYNHFLEETLPWMYQKTYLHIKKFKVGLPCAPAPKPLWSQNFITKRNPPWIHGTFVSTFSKIRLISERDGVRKSNFCGPCRYIKFKTSVICQLINGKKQTINNPLNFTVATQRKRYEFIH